MEIELKYLVEDDFSRDKLLEDAHLCEMKEEGSERCIAMKAVYFDTKDGSLGKERIVLRCRRENDRYMATVKWGGSSENGLHTRGELNVPVDEFFFDAPHIDIIEGSEIYETVKAATGDKALRRVMEMEFVRKEIRVDTGKSISVISVDEGVIRTDVGLCPLSEVEIELFSGSQEDMVALGEELCAKYNLVPCNTSKLQRGFEFIEARRLGSRGVS